MAYKEAIEIDPMCVEAYLGMAKAYEAMGDATMALQILKQGYEKTGDEQLVKEIDRLEQLLGSAGIKPVEGEVILPYSMEEPVYFATLDQYLPNPGIFISAKEGTTVKAALGGPVIDIYTDDRLGQMLVMDLGGGDEVTYGQLKNIQVAEGDIVATGDIIAEVAAPTKFYLLEGSNLYIKVTKHGEPADPEKYFQW